MQATHKASGQRRPPAVAPRGFNSESLFGGVHWHQRWEVYEGVFTPGRNPVDHLCDMIGLPSDLKGQRILDIGAWHGCFSFECERRGAAEVVALTLETPQQTGFDRLARAVDSKVVRFVQESAYCLDRTKLGEFDLVLFLGVLYHLRYPLLAIDKIRTVSRGPVLIESYVIDDHWKKDRTPHGPYQRLADVSAQLTKTPLWRYFHNDELLGDTSNCFGPNIIAVKEAFESAGFDVKVLKQWGDRAAFQAVPRQALQQALTGTYECFSAPNRNFLSLDGVQS